MNFMVWNQGLVGQGCQNENGKENGYVYSLAMSSQGGRDSIIKPWRRTLHTQDSTAYFIWAAQQHFEVTAIILTFWAEKQNRDSKLDLHGSNIQTFSTTGMKCVN